MASAMSSKLSTPTAAPNLPVNELMESMFLLKSPFKNDVTNRK